MPVDKVYANYVMLRVRVCARVSAFLRILTCVCERAHVRVCVCVCVCGFVRARVCKYEMGVKSAYKRGMLCVRETGDISTCD